MAEYETSLGVEDPENVLSGDVLSVMVERAEPVCLSLVWAVVVGKGGEAVESTRVCEAEAVPKPNIPGGLFEEASEPVGARDFERLSI